MPMQVQRLTGLKKRQQIQNANKVMFVWIAIASVAVSVCVVLAQFYLQKFAYNNKVIGVKIKAVDTLKDNITNAQQLKKEVDALVGNQDLASVKTKTSDSNTKVVLDALPSVLDTTALATSLQQAILSRSGVTVESITVPAASSSTNDATGSQQVVQSKPTEQPFAVVVTGSYDKIKALIQDMERTIRPVKITSVSMLGEDAFMRVSIEAITYWQPAKSTSIKTEAVK